MNQAHTQRRCSNWPQGFKRHIFQTHWLNPPPQNPGFSFLLKVKVFTFGNGRLQTVNQSLHEHPRSDKQNRTIASLKILLLTRGANQRGPPLFMVRLF